ncbi:MAG TPA: thioredoxin domain-containing protein [Anaeromyxobacteraceae bacterium]|nr:thioredoxin domain-containing protein [Anaeromyxobacteraceae bacterium]
MTVSSRLAAAALATGLAAACASGATHAPPASRTAPPAAASPEEALPGVDLSELGPAQREAVSRWAQASFSYCGAPRTVSAALRQGSSCKHAPRMARLAVRLAAAGVAPAALARAVTDYYAAFDAPKRAKLELAGFGPPLGEERAPVTMVEFSDFTCPACQHFRPTLEKFVADRPGRVRLYFKPYAIPTHVNSMEAAEAAEWARERGAFWKMHDTLFENAFVNDPESLAGFARGLGLDGDDLAAALAGERYVAKVEGSMAEARAAGLAGTPTLFLDGRMIRLPDLSEPWLQFTLEDEEEWVAHGGWIRD